MKHVYPNLSLKLDHTCDRRPYVKFIWFVALVIFTVLCSIRINESFGRFFKREVSTTYREGVLTFEFPDIYLCNENPISGSFSVTLSAENAALLSQVRRRVNDSLLKGTTDKSDQLEKYALNLINSLPFRFLSDVMGQRKSQSLIDFTINDLSKRDEAVLYRHNTYLNCLWLNLSSADRTLMRSPSSRLSLTLFLDPQIPPPYDNSTEQDVLGTTNLKPFDWDITYGYDYSRSNGFRLFLVPQGQQPNEWSTQFVAGPGERKDVEVKMEDIILTPEDFEGQCVVADDSSAEYVNPYSGEKETVGYEFYVCVHKELARISQVQYNCSAHRYPLPWEYRDLPSCYNLTAVSGLNLTKFSARYDDIRASILSVALRFCRGKKPCKRREYSFAMYSTAWPSSRLLSEYLLNFISDQMIESPSVADETHLPGIMYLLANTSQAKESLLQLTFYASDEKGTETQLAISYNLNSLIADMGGLLGLFLGMSLLSALEFVELLHDCILEAYNRLEKRPQTAPSSPASTDNDSSFVTAFDKR